MIINIRGTSGSGKSTLMRSVMALYPGKVRHKVPGRKQPIGYVLSREGGGTSLAVPGHYEVACGGCDTISDYETIYSKIREADGLGLDVLYEGLLISGESARPIQLHNEGRKIHVIALSTPIEVCIASINQRRQEKRGPDAPPVKERNTIAKARAVEIAMGKMADAGIPCEWLDRDAAFLRVRELLGI
jgi:ABC-type dipeptide/oligopeptide/nickel transport system ATPase component